MADRHVAYALIGGGLAAGNCARWLRESGADGQILLIGREPDLPYNRPPCSKGYLQGKRVARGHAVPAARVVRGAAGRGADPRLGQVARPVRAQRRAVRRPGGELRQGPGRHRRRRSPPVGPGRRARGHPLPAHAGQQRHDPRGRLRQARRADRRLLHRLRGRRLADRARQLLLDGDARAGRAQPRFRRAGRAVLPVPARGARDRGPRRRRARPLRRRRRPRDARRHQGGPRARRRRGRDRRGRRARRAARPHRRPRDRRARRRAGRLPPRRPPCPASSRPATSPSTRAWSTAASGCASSTGTSPSTRARPPR